MIFKRGLPMDKGNKRLLTDLSDSGTSSKSKFPAAAI